MRQLARARHALAIFFALFTAFATCGAAAASASEPPSERGELVFRDGQLASGEALVAKRADQAPLRGRDAACAQCHGRSGLGSVEGGIVVPPITGRFLFRPGQRMAAPGGDHADSAHLPPTPLDRGAYDDRTLARAIRDGIGADGAPLNFLMPRFDLDDAAMGDLIQYLKRLSGARIRGVTPDTLNFATIVTPDADPVARDGMLNVLEKYFAEKNSYLLAGPAPRPQAPRSIWVQARRKWNLRVWKLTGDPADWESELDQLQRREPVFAVISGLGGATWAPVHRFCQRQAIACLLPNVDLPVVDPDDFYSIYFSQGVLLEAQLIANRLVASKSPGGPDGRVLQVFRADDVGASAAARLREAMPANLTSVERPLAQGDGPEQLARALRHVGPNDTVVLWLRAADLATLPAPPGVISGAYVSGLMGGLESAPLPPAWRTRARMTYPFELPDARSLRLNYPLGWFHLRQIPVVAERVQVDTYIACSVLVDAVGSMLDEFVPEYLIERTEAMMNGRLVNGYYTRLGLAHGQRFASKGGYIVRFDGEAGAQIQPDSPWIVP